MSKDKEQLAKVINIGNEKRPKKVKEIQSSKSFNNTRYVAYQPNLQNDEKSGDNAMKERHFHSISIHS